MSVTIKLGLKFTSTHFAATAEVSAASEKDNTLDVILTPTDGNAWEEKGWNLQHTKWGFEQGEYKEVEPETFHLSVW